MSLELQRQLLIQQQEQQKQQSSANVEGTITKNKPVGAACNAQQCSQENSSASGVTENASNGLSEGDSSNNSMTAATVSKDDFVSLLTILSDIINFLPEILNEIDLIHEQKDGEAKSVAIARLRLLQHERGTVEAIYDSSRQNGGTLKALVRILKQALEDIDLIDPNNEKVDEMWMNFYKLEKKLKLE